MSITFLIGNGFDIGLGLATKYEQVYSTYLEQSVKDKSLREFKRLLKKGISSDVTTWSDFEMAISKNIAHFDNEQDFVYCVDDFKRHLRSHLDKENNKFLTIMKHSPERRERLVREMETFLEKGYYQGLSANVMNRVETANPWLGGLQLIDFNYTSLLDYVVSFGKKHNPLQSICCIFDRCSISHVHGSISENDMVLGVDDVTQLQDCRFEIGQSCKRSFIKPYLNEEYDESRINCPKTWINNSEILCAFGASLGDSDLMWRDMVFSHLQEDTSCLFIYWDIDLMKKKELPINEQIDEAEKRKTELLNQWHISLDSKVRDRVLLPVGKTPFSEILPPQ